MDPFPRQQRLAALRQKLAALTTELVKTEEELTTLEADGQLNPNAGVEREAGFALNFTNR
jgi:hypothetical protein